MACDIHCLIYYKKLIKFSNTSRPCSIHYWTYLETFRYDHVTYDIRYRYLEIIDIIIASFIHLFLQKSPEIKINMSNVWLTERPTNWSSGSKETIMKRVN